MAPRTRSNRGESLAKAKLLASGRTYNTEGFLALPAELHLEILSHLPAMPVPTHIQAEDDRDVDGFCTRHATLLALSQTCRALRRISLRQLWQRIEVFDDMQTPKGPLPKTNARVRASFDSVRLKLYAEELIRQLEVVTIREPGYAQYVQIVNVVITGYSIQGVLDEVAKAFSLLPNLHTVQLNLTAGQRLIPLIFKDRRYPQIRTLSLTMQALPFADHCPEARVIVPYFGRYFVAYPKNCPNLEVLGITSLARKCTASHMKNLRDISVVTGSPVFPAQFEPLRELPHLNTIRLRIDTEGGQWGYSYYYIRPRRPRKAMDQSEVDQRIEYAREILSQKGGDKSRKKIIVTYEDGRIETLGV